MAALVEALPWGPGADAGAVPHALGRGWVWPWQHPSPSSNGPHHGHGNASCELLAGGHVAHCDWPTHSASALGAFRGRGDPAAADGPPYIGLVVPTQASRRVGGEGEGGRGQQTRMGVRHDAVASRNVMRSRSAAPPASVPVGELRREGRPGIPSRGGGPGVGRGREPHSQHGTPLGARPRAGA